MYSINQLSSPPSDLNLKTKASLLVTPWSLPVLLQKGVPCLQYPGYMIGRWFQIVVEQSFHQKETWQSLQLLKPTKDLTCAEQFINLGHETASKPFLLLKVLFLEWHNTVLDMQKKIFFPRRLGGILFWILEFPKHRLKSWKERFKFCCLISSCGKHIYVTPKSLKTESVTKLSNFNFQRTKILYQNNLKHITCFFLLFSRAKDVISHL